MVCIKLCYARPEMHLARAATGDDGEIVAGAGTQLTTTAIAALRRVGVERVWVREADRVADWEEDRPLPQALAALEARFALEPASPILMALLDALRRRLIASLDGRREDGP